MSPDGEGRPQQMVFDLAGDPGHARDDFLVSPCNEAAFYLIDMWPNWPGSTLLLVGPPGSGKSHLAAIWASKAEAIIVRPKEGLHQAAKTQAHALLLEDCDRRNGSEVEFFHFLNLINEQKRILVMTGRQLPDRWGLKTADLLSRLRQVPVAELAQIDEPLIRAILVKLFADRQLTVDKDVVGFAARNIDRSFEAVELFVRSLDEASLSSGKAISRVMATRVISDMRGLNF